MRSLLLLLLPTLAHAEVCAPTSTPATLFATAAGPVLCFDATCAQVADGKKVARPKATAAKPKKKLAAAIKKNQADLPDPTAIRYSADGKWAAVVEHLWNVDADKEEKVKDSAPGGGHLVFVLFAGNTPIGEYLDCAGPCGVGYPLVDGAPIGKGFAGGGGIMLDDKRALIAPFNAPGQVSIVELKTGASLGTVNLADGSAVMRSAAVKLAGDDAAVFYDNLEKSEVVQISAPAGKPATIVKTTPIRFCPN